MMRNQNIDSKKCILIRPFLNTNFYGNTNDNLVISEESSLFSYANTNLQNWYFFVNTDVEKNLENSYEG